MLRGALPKAAYHLAEISPEMRWEYESSRRNNSENHQVVETGRAQAGHPPSHRTDLRAYSEIAVLDGHAKPNGLARRARV
jgi:hypothetical protein